MITAGISFYLTWVTLLMQPGVIGGGNPDPDEFRLHEQKVRPLVIARFREQYGAVPDSGFWNNVYCGNRPSDMLKQLATESYLHARKILACARKAGLTGDIGYDAIRQSRLLENERRQRAKEAGEVIFGPINYSESVYYWYVLSNLEIRLNDKKDQ